MEKLLSQFTKYERARILGARALQVSMDAPVLLKLTPEELESLNYDSLKIAQKELDEGILPISISRPLPEKRDSKLKAVKKEAVLTTPGNAVEKEAKVEDGDEIVQELEQEFESETEEESSSSSDAE